MPGFPVILSCRVVASRSGLRDPLGSCGCVKLGVRDSPFGRYLTLYLPSSRVLLALGAACLFGRLTPQVTMICLLILLCLHVYWFYLLLRVLYKIILVGPTKAGKQEYEGTSLRKKAE